MQYQQAVPRNINRLWSFLPLISALLLAQYASADSVSALGRLEPEHGVLHIGVASSSHAISGSIIAELLVNEGDWVEAGQLLATTDSTTMMQAVAQKSITELELAIRQAEAVKSASEEACTLADVAAGEAARRARLLEQNLASKEETEQAQGDARATAASCKAAHANTRVAEYAIEVAKARIEIDQLEIERSKVHAPIAGRVLEIHTRPGEMAGIHSVLDLARTDRMFAIAEVYETDIGNVEVGQAASVSSDALPRVLSGKVERIRPKVQKMDVIGTDPAARKDARIIEVEIRLDESEAAANLTNLQVEIVIGD